MYFAWLWDNLLWILIGLVLITLGGYFLWARQIIEHHIWSAWFTFLAIVGMDFDLFIPAGVSIPRELGMVALVVSIAALATYWLVPQFLAHSYQQWLADGKTMKQEKPPNELVESRLDDQPPVML